MKSVKTCVSLRFFQRAAFVLFWIAGVSMGRAEGLEWERTAIEIAAKPADKTVTADFAFRNTTDHPVEIRKIRTSCGCTVAESAKKSYAPGEQGAVKAVFTIGGRKGKQEKTIIVETSEKKSSDVLILRVNLPDTVKVNKEMLNWNIGDPLEAQSFEVSVVESGSAKVVNALPLGTGFQADLKELEPGKKYEIVVKPLSTEHPAEAALRLEVTDPGPRVIYLRMAVAE